MSRLLTGILVVALGCGLSAANAQDGDSDKARTAGQIMQKREKACEGLKGEALEECRSNYVGPEPKSSTRFGRDSIYVSKHKGLYRPKPGDAPAGAPKPGRY